MIVTNGTFAWRKTISYVNHVKRKLRSQRKWKGSCTAIIKGSVSVRVYKVAFDHKALLWSLYDQSESEFEGQQQQMYTISMISWLEG